MRKSAEVFGGFLLDLVNQPWEEVINEKITVHQQAKIFQELLESTLNRRAPLRKVKITPNFRKGLSAQTKELIQKRNYTLKKSNKCKDPNRRKFIRAEYKRLRNEVTFRSRKEGKLSFKNRVKETNIPSEKWKIVREMSQSNN